MSTEKLLKDIILQAMNEKNSLIAQWEDEKKRLNQSEKKELDSIKIREVLNKEEAKKKIKLQCDSLMPSEINILLISKFGNFIEAFFKEYKDKIVLYFKPFNDVKDKINYFQSDEIFSLIIPENDKTNELVILKNLKKNKITVSSVEYINNETYILENRTKTIELKDSSEIYFTQIKKTLYNVLLGFLYNEYTNKCNSENGKWNS